MNDADSKTTVEHWDTVWAHAPRMRLASGLNVAIGNLQRLLRSHVNPGMRFLEIGCAPGNLLIWIAKVLHADVAGLDYSERGLAFARQLFQTFNIKCDLRHENVFTTTFEPESFDIVFSAGVIEHFDDPREIVRKHVALLKPGGKAIIAIPNYGGVYGRLQRHFDPDNLSIHNLDIMHPPALEKLGPKDLTSDIHAYPIGRLSPWLISFGKCWPRAVALCVNYALNTVGLFQPLDIVSLCPMLVLELRRSSESVC
jgi:SAM-dependent methyltransferase